MIRFCVDYRFINKIPGKDFEPKMGVARSAARYELLFLTDGPAHTPTHSRARTQLLGTQRPSMISQLKEGLTSRTLVGSTRYNNRHLSETISFLPSPVLMTPQ